MPKQSLKAIVRLLRGACPERKRGVFSYVFARSASEEFSLMSLRGAQARKQSLKAIVRLLRGACPERHEILHYAQNDTKRRARNDSLNC